MTLSYLVKNMLCKPTVLRLFHTIAFPMHWVFSHTLKLGAFSRVNMAIWVFKFAKKGYKIRFLAKNILKVNYSISWIDISLRWQKSAKIWHSKSIFDDKNHLNLSENNFCLKYQFRRTFVVSDIFWELQFDAQFLMVQCYVHSQNTILFFDYSQGFLLRQ